MKLYLSSSMYHFINIYTDKDDVSAFDNIPNKKPFLIIEIPAKTRYNDDIMDFCSTFSKINHEGSPSNFYSQTFSISSSRRLVEAIDQLITKFDIPKNAAVIQELLAVKAQLPLKNTRAFPRKEKVLSDYKPASDPEITRALYTPPPTHGAIRVIKTSKPKQVSIFKLIEKDRKITQLEAFNGICYRLLLNEQTPKVRSVRDEQGRKVGVLSRAITNFTSLTDLCQRHPATKEELIQAKIGRILAAAYLEQENDLHGGNVAYDKKNKKCYKIDHDHANFGITAKYHYRDYRPAPMVISTKEIDNFPNLKFSTPMNFLYLDTQCFHGTDSLPCKDDPRFISDAFFIFLKQALLDEQIYSKIADATISSEKTRAKLVRQKAEQRVLLEQELLKSKKFIAFMQGTPDLKKEIKKEFAQYNKDYKENDILCIDIKEIAAKFDEFKAKCDAVAFIASEVIPNEKNARSLQKHTMAFNYDAILNDILQLAGKLGRFGGEKRTYEGQQIALPRGVAIIFDLCIAYRDDDVSAVDTLNAIIAQAQQSQQETKHTFFNRRQPETQAFYDKFAAMAAAEVENSVTPS